MLKFFETSTRNLLTYEAAAGVGHHVALISCGNRPAVRKRLLPRQDRSGETDQKLTDSLLDRACDAVLRVPQGPCRHFRCRRQSAFATCAFPADGCRRCRECAGKIAVGPPVNGIVEIGGPEQFRLDELVRRRLASLKDPREVIADPNALYSGAKISERTLVPGITHDSARRVSKPGS